MFLKPYFQMLRLEFAKNSTASFFNYFTAAHPLQAFQIYFQICRRKTTHLLSKSNENDGESITLCTPITRRKCFLQSFEQLHRI